MAITVRAMIERLSKLDPDLEVWVEDGASVSGYAPATGVGENYDESPAPGEPQEFATIFVE